MPAEPESLTCRANDVFSQLLRHPSVSKYLGVELPASGSESRPDCRSGAADERNDVLLVVVEAQCVDPPGQQLRAAVREQAGTPTILAGVHVPMTWTLATTGLLCAPHLCPEWLAAGVAQELRKAVSPFPEFDGVAIEATSEPLAPVVERWLVERRFSRLIVLARRRDGRAVRRVLRRAAHRVHHDVLWI